MANLSVTLELDNQGYIRGIRASEDAVKKFGQTTQTSANQAANSLDRVNTSANVVSANLTKLRNVVLGAAFASFARSSLMAAEELEGLAGATGIATVELLKMRDALNNAGVPAANFNQTILRFVEVVDEATERGSLYNKALMDIGITEKELISLPLPQLFERVVAQLSQITDSGTRAARVVEIFGRRAGEMVPAEVLEKLNLTAEQLRKVQEQAKGIQEADAAMKAFNATVLELQNAFVQVFQPIISLVSRLIKDIPILTGLLQALLAVIVAIGIASGFGLLLRGLQAIAAGFRSILALAQRFRRSGGPESRAAGPFDELRDLAENARARAAQDPTNTALRRRAIDAQRRLEQAQQQRRDQIQQGIGTGAGLVGAGAVAYESITGGEQPTTVPQEDRFGSIRRFLGLSQTAGTEVNRPITESKEQESAAERLQTRLDTLRDRIRDISTAYNEYSNELKSNNFLAEYSLALSENEIELNDAILDVRQRASKSLQDYQSILDNLKTEEMGLKPIIEAQMAAIRERARVDEQSVVDSVRAIQKYREEMEVLADEIETRNRALINQEGLTQLQEEIALIGLYGEALEDQQAILAVTQELRNKLLGIQQEENDLILEKDRLGEVAFQREMARLKALREEAYEYAEERLRLEQELIEKQRELQDDWQKALGKQLEELADSITPAKLATDLFSSAINSVDNALTEFVNKGKFSFKDFARSLLRDMALIIARALIMRTILAAFGLGGFGPMASAGGTSSMALNYTGPQFGGFAAKGGILKGGVAYMVGEKGPELFVPKSTGLMIPNNQLAMAGNGGGTTVNYNINAVDASSFRSLVARDPQFIYNVTEVGRRSSPARRLA